MVFKSGSIVPLSKTIFDINSVENAFRYMSSGKHIGKVIIKIMNDENSEIKIMRKISVNAQPSTIFSPKKSYIVVGGLGGFGLELINWMILKGARNLIINSRKGIKNNYQLYFINRVKSMDARLIIKYYDITNRHNAEKLIYFSKSYGELGGIFNLATVQRDGLLAKQSASSFERVIKAKVNITENLDIISRQICEKLDYFVVFSSVFSGEGNPGQTNYGFANSCMEMICKSRRRDGLHGLAIQWATVVDVGVVADRITGNRYEIAGFIPQKIVTCLEILDRFLQTHEPILCSYIWAVQKEVSFQDKKCDLMKKIYNILGINEESKLNPNTTLGEMGMDSLTANEIQQTLDEVGGQLSVNDLRNVTVYKLIEMSN